MPTDSVHEFLRSGAQAVAYPSIVASGPNACVLHYRDNDRQMQAGDLLLIDAGCEYQGYASDITRTFPVSGKFTGPQKDVYELVLDAQLACIDAVKPGRRVPRLPRGRRARARARAASISGCARARSTRCSSPAATSSSTCIAPVTGSASTCTTPGLYQRARASRARWSRAWCSRSSRAVTSAPRTTCPRQFRDIGVRIEDDVLVTATGNENLTAATPKTVADVEAACAR